jgi:hypothetical protein
MKNFLFYTTFFFSVQIFLSCSQRPAKTGNDFVAENAEFAARQYGLLSDIIEDSGRILNPKTFINGKIKYIPPQEWTSGFFPGSMWYLYELTNDSKWKELGTKYTEALDSVKFLTSHHDVGFMIGSSFGNGLRLTGNDAYKEVIVQAARSLSTRFRPVAGIIQSWNVTGGWQAERGWECPVIIDNMMNLELLFNATKYSGDSSFYKIAVSHADNTLKNHFRPDFSTWHVVDYSLTDGSVRHRQTAQGYSDESVWARGQAWAVYGYTVCFRETKNPKYLEQAEKAFEFVARHPNLPSDAVPYWDYNAPDIPNEKRDASAAAILASALYELSTYVKKEYYKGWADKIMQSLASTEYRATEGENSNFILKHCVGSIPHNSEVDVPLNYADYYFLEALKRKRDMEK